MPISKILRKKRADEALTKVKVKAGTINKALNKLILFFMFVILPLQAAIIAIRQEYIVVPELILVFLEAIVTILVSYTLATVFIKLTIYLVPDRFDGAGTQEEKILFSKIYVAFIYALSTLVVFWQLGIDSRDMAIFLGLIATGFAFALRDVIFSYFAWFILLTKKPFKIGDYIEIGDEEGMVKHIGLFYVVVDHTPSTYEDFHKIPNKVFLEKTITNHGKGKFRLTFDYYLKDIPAYLDDRIESIREKARSAGYGDARFHLDSDHDGLKLTTEYRATFESREKTRHNLLCIIMEELGILGSNEAPVAHDRKKARYSL
ncbi:mechanosensitive ion channel domain-containing protein [Methanolobus chelungpuianus]|uniref:Mechanosensitive ion channel protein MscS n=1 Tax=Methanolobus chelungpuianus TaxID=502115 RepID=A0AAE3HAM1_9EURY|nr:mechanosensitive ion channel domain-containing protein [Methanolobus chelungpuianus]MCQ6962624.1 mechanosensitive ion channel protein MscS [Methanolobus chelungpuianus]